MAQQEEKKNGKHDAFAPVVAVVLAATVAAILTCGDLSDCNGQPHKIRTMVGCVYCP